MVLILPPRWDATQFTISLPLVTTHRHNLLMGIANVPIEDRVLPDPLPYVYGWLDLWPFWPLMYPTIAREDAYQ